MNKVDPPAGWASQSEGCTPGNPYSPVILVIPVEPVAELGSSAPSGEATPAAIDAGAAAVMALSTPNVGIERVVACVVANPNVRYLLVSGPDNSSRSGAALVSLCRLGEDLHRHIEGVEDPTAAIPDVPPHVLDRFRAQASVLDALCESRPSALADVVRACCANFPSEVTVGEGRWALSDPGAWGGEPVLWAPPER